MAFKTTFTELEFLGFETEKTENGSEIEEDRERRRRFIRGVWKCVRVRQYTYKYYTHIIKRIDISRWKPWTYVQNICKCNESLFAMPVSCYVPRSACKLTVWKVWQNRNLPTWSCSDVKHWTVFSLNAFQLLCQEISVFLPDIPEDSKIAIVHQANQVERSVISDQLIRWSLFIFRDLVAPSTMSWGRLVLGCFWTIILRGQRVTSNWPHHSYGLDVGMSAVETPALFTLYHCFAPH